MSNPLLAKYDELYGKKEEPNKIEMTGTIQISEQQMDVLGKYLKNYSVRDRIILISTPTGADFFDNKTNGSHTSKLTSYDSHSGEDSFLQIAEKVKSKDAKVTSMTIERDVFTGNRITFEVWVN